MALWFENMILSANSWWLGGAAVLRVGITLNLAWPMDSNMTEYGNSVKPW